MDSRDSVIAALQQLPTEVQEVVFKQRGYHLEVIVTAERLRTFAELLRTGDFYLSFISGLHVRPAIEVSYQFANYSFPCRLMARVTVAEDNSLPTISDIFQGANWHERETKDFFGVVFRDHPNLKPLLLAEDMEDLKPLLKKDEALKEREALTRVESTGEEQSSAPGAGKEGA